MYQDFSPSVRTAVRYLVLALLAGLVFAAFAFAFNMIHSTSADNQFSVSGEGSATVRPDVAMFDATVVTQSENIETAQDENAEKSEMAISFLKEAGVEEKDVRTTGYNIYPQYQYFDNPTCISEPCPIPRAPQIVSYEVRHTIEVKARDLEVVDDLLDGVVSVGANEIASIRFTVDEPEAVLEQARAEAIANAKEKAEVLADELDVSLSGIASFTESTGDTPAFDVARSEAGGFGGGAGPIQSGEQEVTVTVNVSYNFR